MTQVIIDDVIPRTQLLAAASQTVFNTNWTADAATDVLVYARAAGIEPNDVTQLVASSNYNVTFIGGSQTVRVTFLVGRTLDDVITIVRDTPAERMNLYINTNFTPSMLNEDFGILTLVDQQAQMYDYVVNPGYNVSATIENIVDTVLPILGANQIWAMNSTRTGIIAYDVPSGGGLAPDDANYLLQVADSELPNAQAMGALASGLVVNTTATGVQLTRSIAGTVTQIGVANGTGIGGNPTIYILPNPIMTGTEGMGIPQGTTAQRPVSPVGTEFRFNTDLIIFEYWDGTSWVQISETDGVVTAEGTANQVLVNGTVGTPIDGAIVLSLPQDIAPASSPQFTNLVLSSGFIADPLSLPMLKLTTVPSAVNYLEITNNITGMNPILIANGTDTNVSVTARGKGTGGFIAQSTSNIPFIMYSGTAYQHLTRFNMANTAQTRDVTFQDSNGTLAYLTDITANGTVNAGTINQIAWYAATGNTISGLTGANGSILVTNSTGVPSMLANPTATGKILQSVNGDAPAYSTATYPSVATTAGTILRANGTNWAATTSTFADTYAVSTILYASSANTIAGLATANSGVLITSSTGVPSILGSFTNGQLLIGSTGASPVKANLSAGPGISINNTAGGITISGTGSGTGFTLVTGTSQAMVADAGYVPNNVALCTLTLPVTAAFGTSQTVVGLGAGGWLIAQNSGQNIQVGNQTTTTGVGGSLASTNRYDSIDLLCVVANTTWVAWGAPQSAGLTFV